VANILIETEGEGRIADRVELQKAIDSVPPRQTVVWPSGPFLTSVAQVEALPPFGVYRRPRPPEPPSTPVGLAQRDTGSQGLTVVSRPADDVVAAPEAEKPGIEPTILERVAGVSVQLDIAVERRRFFWWRLALSMVVRRLGR
jgi:hypothetical protein